MTKAQKAVVFILVLMIAWLLHVTTCEWEFKGRHPSGVNVLFGYQEQRPDGEWEFTGLRAQPISGGSLQSDSRIYRLLVILVGVAMPIGLVGADVYLLPDGDRRQERSAVFALNADTTSEATATGQPIGAPNAAGDETHRHRMLS